MGNSKYVNEPTISRGAGPVRKDSEESAHSIRAKQFDANSRAVAQPLPGADIPKVEERAEASVEEKERAVKEHSKLRKAQKEEEEQPPQDNAAPLQEEDENDDSGL